MTAMSRGPFFNREKSPHDQLNRIFRNLLPLILAIGLSVPSLAQQVADTSSQSPAYTLHGSARIVLTDVTVKDHAGHLVHGLPASAFHIFDNNQPQTITTFEENNAAPTAIKEVSATAPNTYSNEFLQHLPPVLNIVVLDVVTLSVTDQMYLSYEFNRFLKTLPPDLPIALYARVGAAPVLIQDFTSDHQRLLAASAKVMPHLPLPGFSNPGGDAHSLLHQIATELAQIPGHKNVLWFSGGPGLQNFDPLAHPQAIGAPESSNLRLDYDLLEKARISVYPIDARGLMINSSLGDAFQHIEMRDIADNTGGQVFYNRNALTKISNDILATDNSFYTLVFSPKDFTPNNKWHRITVKVEGSHYQLSYRRGYYADGFNLDSSEDKRPRTQLLEGGRTRELPANLRTSPIIFSASIFPFGSPNPEPGKNFYSIQSETAPTTHMKGYTIRYTIPADSFINHMVDGHESATFDVAFLAVNPAATRASEAIRHVSVTFPKNGDSIATINLAQDVVLPLGDLYLYVAVWDTTTGRTGTLQIPFTAK